MKRSLVVMMLVLLLATVMVATIGCGDSGDGEEQKDDTAADRTVDRGEEEPEYSVVGTYESDEGKFIILNDDGTFETDDWEEKTGGTYEFTQDQVGYSVELTFDEDGSLAVLEVIIAMDEVAALVDDFTMVQYNKR